MLFAQLIFALYAYKKLIGYMMNNYIFSRGKNLSDLLSSTFLYVMFSTFSSFLSSDRTLP